MGNQGRDYSLNAKLSRRNFLKAAGAGAAWIALTSTLGCEFDRRPRAAASPERPTYVRSFRSRPDLHPPSIDVLSPPHNFSTTATGYIFVAPKNGPREESPSQDGPLILDDRGEPVWFRPLHNEEKDTMDFKVQYYQGEPVLTFWEGYHTGYGLGEYVILDSSYKEIKRLEAGNGYLGDHHEFLITDRNTALITIYSKVDKMDLASVGGSREGRVLDGIAQEVDIESGEVLFEWHSLKHVGIDQSYARPPKNPAYYFDYFHINSIDVDHDSNLLISARRTSTVYKVDRQSGEVMWQLGGKMSDFEMDPRTRRSWQHDARRQSDGTITIFDNGGVRVDEQSRGLVLELDMGPMNATVVREYTHPDKLLAATQGNVQVLPGGNVFIGWGSQPVFSEFSREGELLFDARFPPQVESYRAFRFPWKGHPTDDPALVAVPGEAADELSLYVSWNGATEVASWRVLAGPNPDRLEAVGPLVPKEGFETAIRVRSGQAYVGVEARDGSGRVLGTSRAVRPSS
jgi:Arylsulfotransferase (ASST)/TAT (twin-arginine translocation) pathway signal sequence